MIKISLQSEMHQAFATFMCTDPQPPLILSISGRIECSVCISLKSVLLTIHLKTIKKEILLL